MWKSLMSGQTKILGHKQPDGKLILSKIFICWRACCITKTKHISSHTSIVHMQLILKLLILWHQLNLFWNISQQGAGATKRSRVWKGSEQRRRWCSFDETKICMSCSHLYGIFNSLWRQLGQKIASWQIKDKLATYDSSSFLVKWVTRSILIDLATLEHCNLNLSFYIDLTLLLCTPYHGGVDEKIINLLNMFILLAPVLCAASAGSTHNAEEHA